ncbi:MAG: Crp/Fnr family transcriptional regulator [Eubacteriales bacterium]
MKTVKRLNEFPIFSVLSDEACEKLLEQGKIREQFFAESQSIRERAVYCVLSGTAAVYSADEAHPLLLRYLKPGDIFGVATLYAGDDKISRIEAKNNVKLLSVPKSVIHELLTTDEDFLTAYLAFLSDRIAFLNGKISCIGAGSAERKLAAWLTGHSESDDFDLPVSISDLARLLDLGRASLYRAFDALIDRGCIVKNGSHITILNRLALQTVPDTERNSL